MKGKIKYSVPDENTPGYMKREKLRIEYVRASQSLDMDDLDFELMDNIMELRARWLACFVIKPADKEEAYSAILEMSKNEVDKMQEEVLDTGPDPKESEPSDGG